MSGYAISCDSAPRLSGLWPTYSTEIDPIEKVFNIVELCEQILEYLPCADLNRARSVCRQFRKVINQSTLMRQRSSLRLASNQIVWAAPDNTLLTSIYAEDHIAAMKAKGRKKDELLVYEMHPYLKVVHLNVEGYQFSHRHIRESEPEGLRFYGFHRFRVGNFCLLNFPDHFPLDDEYISYPPVKEIEVYMRHTHEDNLPVRNKYGIKFKDIRAAVKKYLIEYSHERNWQSCSNTITSTERTTNIPRPHGQRWIMESGSSIVYDCEQIFFRLCLPCYRRCFSLRDLHKVDNRHPRPRYLGRNLCSAEELYKLPDDADPHCDRGI